MDVQCDETTVDWKLIENCQLQGANPSDWTQLIDLKLLLNNRSVQRLSSCLSSWTRLCLTLILKETRGFMYAPQTKLGTRPLVPITGRVFKSKSNHQPAFERLISLSCEFTSRRQYLCPVFLFSHSTWTRRCSHPTWMQHKLLRWSMATEEQQPTAVPLLHTPHTPSNLYTHSPSM